MEGGRREGGREGGRREGERKKGGREGGRREGGRREGEREGEIIYTNYFRCLGQNSLSRHYQVRSTTIALHYTQSI